MSARLRKGHEGTMYELTDWGVDGIAELTVEGRSLESILQRGLQGVLAVSQAEGNLVRLQGGRSMSLKAEAADAAGLFAGLIASMFDQAENISASIADLTIDGVLHGENGYTAWGSLQLGDGGLPLRETELAEPARVSESGSHLFRLEARLRRMVNGG